MSDAHTGLKKAIGTVFQGASWQRCRVHFMRNVLSIVPKGSQEMVASIIRTIFAQPDKEHVLTQFDEVTRMLTRSHPKVAAMLEDAKGDVLAFTGFPQRHWRQIWSTNPLVISSDLWGVRDVQHEGVASCGERVGCGYLRSVHDSYRPEDQCSCKGLPRRGRGWNRGRYSVTTTCRSLRSRGTCRI